jgi:excisionase family DNA binding protein
MKDSNLNTFSNMSSKEIVISLIASTGKDNVVKLAFSVPEVAKSLGLNNTKVYAMVKAGHIPHTMWGNRIVIPVTSFVDWLDQSARSMSKISA